MESLAFRQRLLGLFSEPMTVKAAAAQLGTPPGRLYHHLDRLLAEGLIRQVGERRIRGAVERTFMAAATAPQVASARLRLTPERAALLKHRLHDLLRALETPDGVETEIVLVVRPADG